MATPTDLEGVGRTIVEVDGVGPVEVPNSWSDEKIDQVLRRDYPLMLSTTGERYQRPGRLSQAREILAQQAIEETPRARIGGIPIPHSIFEGGRGLVEGIPSSILGAGEYAERWLGAEDAVFGPARRGYSRFIEGIHGPELPETGRFLDEVPRAVGAGLGSLAGLVATGGVAGLGARALGYAPAAAATLAGRALVPISYASEAQEAYKRELDRQEREGEPRNTAKAEAKAAAYGTVASILESRLGAGRLVNRLTGGEPVLGEAGERVGARLAQSVAGRPVATRSTLAGVGREGLAGGIEEGSQNIAQQLIVEGRVDPREALLNAIGGIVGQAPFGAEQVGRSHPG
jgi:hypothetical protein